jgi:hypothetical protein
MTADLKQKIHLFLLAAIVVASARTGYILYERHAENTAQARKQPPPLNPDYYVTPKKLHPYDLKSARQLTQQPVWVKVGYYYTYYPYQGQHADFAHPAGQLPPLDELQIKDIVTDVTPGSPDQRQVMAVFDKDGKTWAFPIGMEKAGEYRIYSDDMLFIQDPRELYKHWPPEVWQAIDQHQAKVGMSELQVDFAIGFGALEGSGDPRILDYPNGGKPLRITYQNGKAVEIQPGG